VLNNKRVKKIELQDKHNLCIAASPPVSRASEEIPICEQVVPASDLARDKVIDTPTKYKIGAHTITESVDFQRELLYLHSWGIGFLNNFDLQQISIELEKAKQLLPLANLTLVKYATIGNEP